MSHQPFETWILDQQTLPIDDRRALQAHLDDCPQCLRLQRRWQMVHQELQLRPDGCPQRQDLPCAGKTGLAERKAREQRKQAWKMAGLLFAAALIVLVLAAAYTLATTSPTDWLVALVGVVSSSTGFLNLGIHFVQQLALQHAAGDKPRPVDLPDRLYQLAHLCLGDWFSGAQIS